VAVAFDRPVSIFFGRDFSMKVRESYEKTEFFFQTGACHYEMGAPLTDEWQKFFEAV